MKRFRQNLSHYKLMTMNLGQLIPAAVVEVLPGDSFRQASSALIRAATLTAPVMHPVTARIHHWFVPNRILWDGWEDFVTGKNTVDTIPQITPDGNALCDAFGLPDNQAITVNALPIRAYNKIFNEFYRDQDIDDELAEDQLDLQNVRWEKDYFTTARTSPQKGDAVTIPINLEGEIPVHGMGMQVGADFQNSAENVLEAGGNATTYDANDNRQTSNSGGLTVQQDPNHPGAPNLYAQLSESDQGVNVDINELREAFALQRFLEHRNRFGSRHVDYLRYLGIRPSDGRLDRPEYLGGGKQTLAFSEVLAHAQDDSGANPVDIGDLKGHGIAAMRTRRYRRFFEESGYVVSLFSVRPKIMYMDRIARTFLRTQKDDFWQKENEGMGPQEVLTSELYGDHSDTTTVFGYNGRHDDYRRHPSYVTGEFKNVSNNWHFARDFTEAPVLNPDFLKCDPEGRPFASQINSELLCMISHRIQARRLVAKNARY